MPTVATIPVTIEPEAAAFIDEVGQRRELEAILEHAKLTIPYLRELVVTLHDFPETGSLNLVIDAHRDPLPRSWDMADHDFAGWMIENYPSEVLQNMVLMSVYHNHAR